jgi:hypothetical protein
MEDFENGLIVALHRGCLSRESYRSVARQRHISATIIVAILHVTKNPWVHTDRAYSHPTPPGLNRSASPPAATDVRPVVTSSSVPTKQ